MGILLGEVTNKFELFLLVFVRMTGLFVMSPIFGRRNVPAYFKIGLALLMSFIVFSSKVMYLDTVVSTFAQFAYLILREFAIGFVVGFIVTTTFSAVLVAGQIIDTQIGFGIVHVLDPQNSIQIPLIGNFNNVIALVVFFAVDGHHTLIRLIWDSYHLVPLGGAYFSQDIWLVFLKVFSDSFVLAFKIALPIVAAAFLSEVAFGIMVKTVPQMNIFVIGIPFKILVGLVILLLIIPAYIKILNGTFQRMFENIDTIIRGMIP